MRHVLVCLALLVVGCSDHEVGRAEHDVTVDTEGDLAWRQHQANLGFAEAYVPRCRLDPLSARPRVLVTGFGRFRNLAHNATGQMVARLLPELDYPLTSPPPEGEVDRPGAQLAVAQGIVESPSLGEVEVCAMVLPVFWDLAGALILMESEAFAPDLLVMNGVARARQTVWLEMGAVNLVSGSDDGSSVLASLQAGLPVLEGAPWSRPSLASWEAIRAASRAALPDDAPALSSVLLGAELVGFPRTSSDYICNNTSFVVGYGMDHPHEALALMVASHPRDESRASLELTPSRDQSHVPRWFAHWPSRLVDEPGYLDVASGVLWAQLEAQLLAHPSNDPPLPGDNALADKPADTAGGG